MRSLPRQVAGVMVILLSGALIAAAIATRPWFSTEEAYRLSRWLVLAEIISALGLACALAVRRWSDIDRRMMLAGATITAIAVGLRLFAPTWAFFHENRHGYWYIVEILRGGPGLAPPSTYYVLMNVLLQATAPTEQTVFLANALISGATVPLLGLVTFQVSGRAAAGWAAMGLWALCPHAIRLAPTEIYFNVGLFLLMAGTSATIHALRRMERERLPVTEFVLAMLLSTLAAQTRAITLVWPVTILLMAFGAGVIRSHRQWLGAVALCQGIFVLLIPKLFFLWGHGHGDAHRRLFEVAAIGNLDSVTFLDNALISPTLPPLVFAGVIVLLSQGARLGRLASIGVVALFVVPAMVYLEHLVSVSSYLGAAALLVAGVVWLSRRSAPGPATGPGFSAAGLSVVAAILFPAALSMIILNQLISSLRFDLAPHALLTILAGVGITGIAGRLHGGGVSRLRHALSLLLVLSTLGAAPLIWRNFADPAEHRLLLDSVIPELREAAAPVDLVVPVETGNAARIRSEWWELHVPGIRVWDDLDAVPLEARRDAWAYVGYTCYRHYGPGAEERYEGDTPPDGGDIPPPAVDCVEGNPRLHPRCAAALEGAAWDAIVTFGLPAEAAKGNARPLPSYVETMTIGLYRARTR